MSTTPLLSCPGWTPAVRSWLEDLIQTGSGQRLPVVFDFDNTLVCGDIGEAVLAMLVRDGLLNWDRLPDHLALSFITADGQERSPARAVDLTEYYETLLSPTVHGARDATPLATGYVWAVAVMQDLNVAEVIQATQKVFALSQSQREVQLPVTAGRTSYPVPYFYPEMVELIAHLLRRQFDVWIVSASNVWSVRWMVQNGLNPLLRQQGADAGLAPDHVIGVATLLADDKKGLHKDSVLVRDNPAYASLQGSLLRTLRVTPWLQFPVPTYSGKVGVIWDAVGRQPHLCAGDSPGDHAMLSFSTHKLWIARLEKPEYLRSTMQLAHTTNLSSWRFQPVLCRVSPGFIPTPDSLDRRLSTVPDKVRDSMRSIESLAG